MKYKLLTPGPLTTSKSVKEVMQFDHCTWDDDYKQITQYIRSELLSLAHAEEPEYSVVLMQGSGSFGVESVLNSSIKEEDTLLIIANGAYGERMKDMADRAHLPYRLYRCAYDTIPSAKEIDAILKEDTSITHIAMVHSETTSGILNDIAAIGETAYAHGKRFIVDAMSSFGGIELDIKACHIDALISSANKCIQGVPGFSFIIAKTDFIESCRGVARTLSLDIYDQWQTMRVDGKWRFTSPTHTVLAFAQALKELREEGGIPARAKRYAQNHARLVANMEELGFTTYLKQHQGPIITTFLYPENTHFTFSQMYNYIKERGYAIYPGKLVDAPCFRIGSIGEIYEEDIEKLTAILRSFLEEVNV